MFFTKKFLCTFYLSIYLLVSSVAWGKCSVITDLTNTKNCTNAKPGRISGLNKDILCKGVPQNFKQSEDYSNSECFIQNNKCCVANKCDIGEKHTGEQDLTCTCDITKKYYLYNQVCLQCNIDGWSWDTDKCVKLCSIYNYKIDHCTEVQGNVIKKDNYSGIDTSNCTCTNCITGYYPNNNECKEKTIKFIFDNDNSNTKSISYTHKDDSNKITIKNKTGYTFAGYCITDTETCYFDEEGNFIKSLLSWDNITYKEIKLISKWTLKTDITCGAGFYLKQNTEQCNTICEKDNYCPGGNKYNFSTTKDQGITHCDNGFSTDGSGKSKQTECIKTCASIENCKNTTGNQYQGGTDDCKCTECNPKFEKSQNEKSCEPKICTEANKYLDDSGECKDCDTTNGYHSPQNNSGGIRSCKKDCNITSCSSYENEKSQIEQGTNETCKCKECKAGKIAKNGNCENCKSPYWCPNDGKNVCKLKSGEASSNIKNDDSKLEALWVDGSGCKCPVGMSSKEQATNITDCKYTKDTKFCFDKTKCFTIKELGGLETNEGKYQDGWKVVY